MIQIGGYVAYIGADHLPVADQLIKQFIRIQEGFMVKMLQKHVFDLTHSLAFFS